VYHILEKKIWANRVSLARDQLLSLHSSLPPLTLTRLERLSPRERDLGFGQESQKRTIKKTKTEEIRLIMRGQRMLGINTDNRSMQASLEH